MVFRDILRPNGFATGVLTYLDRFGNDPNTRIVVPITIEDKVTTTAILDTGAPWCVLNPYEAVALNIEHRADCWEPPKPLMLRGISYRGKLCRIPLAFEAEEGKGITVESTIFIPILAPNEEWRHPNFLGLDGLLNRIRFAVDPEHDHFYFALLGNH